jgi:xanthine/uracil permease
LATFTAFAGISLGMGIIAFAHPRGEDPRKEFIEWVLTFCVFLGAILAVRFDYLSLFKADADWPRIIGFSLLVISVPGILAEEIIRNTAGWRPSPLQMGLMTFAATFTVLSIIHLSGWLRDTA